MYLLIVSILSIFIFSNSQPGPIRIQFDSGIRTIIYHGIRSDDPGGRCGLPNPERGFRLESYIGQPPGTASWGQGHYLLDRATSGFSDDWCLMNMHRFHTSGVTLTQAYCYLTEFIDKPLSQEKFTYLQRSLDRCRQFWC